MLMDYLYSFVLTLSAHLMLLLMLQGTRTICSSDVSPHYWETPYSQPYFDNSSRREVTATVGQAALLHCRVRNLGDRAVSWIRKRDLHILTVGILTYTNDQRFQSLHTEGSDEWTLRISSPQPRDSGTYECQVSTEPKISQGFRLHVVVSRAKILGNTELFIKSGSNINLTCLATQSPVPPSFIYWYKGKRVMNYSQRGGIQVITERSTRTSKLLIEKATPADSGNYTCTPSNSGSASVMVHVINGEQPAAMQHGNSSAISFLIFHGHGQTWRQIVLLLLTQQTVLTLLHRFIYGAFGGCDDGGSGSGGDTGVVASGRSSWSTRRNTPNGTNKSTTSECSSIIAAPMVATGVTMAMCFRTLVRQLLEVKIIKWPANVLHAFGQDPQRLQQRQSQTLLQRQEGDTQSLRLLKLCSNDCNR